MNIAVNGEKHRKNKTCVFLTQIFVYKFMKESREGLEKKRLMKIETNQNVNDYRNYRKIFSCIKY